VTPSNAQVARELAGAYDAGDMERFARLLDPAVELVTVEGWIDGGVFHGRDEVVAFFMRFEEAWEADALEWDAFEEVGERQVVARTRRSLRGKHGGLEALFDQSVVFTVERGAITRLRWFQTREQALEAARESG
jgi:ketosteroid isomerase-like protein